MVNQDVLVLGMGLSGRSAARLLVEQGYCVLGIDDRAATLTACCPIVPTLSMEELASFSFMIVSPGIAPSHPLYVAARQADLPIIGEVEWALRHLRHRAVGVTGTNGKTTVASLTAHALQSGGRPARAVGNIGIPLSEAVLDIPEDEVLIIELSSWQLETAQTPALEAGIVLNITPDHLDRHLTMAQYAKAKLRLADCLKASGSFYVDAATASQFSYLLPSHTQILPTHTSGFEHFNQMASWTLCRKIGLSKEEFDASLHTFQKPPHRMEMVASINGVRYYNDSKGTNIDAVIQAVISREEPCIVIAGGVDKGLAFSAWREIFKSRVRQVYAIGQTAEKIYNELHEVVPVCQCGSLEVAVRKAHHLAQPGESVLLSPGCSSFDQFTNYQHRGEVFRELVYTLANSTSQGEKT